MQGLSSHLVTRMQVRSRFGCVGLRGKHACPILIVCDLISRIRRISPEGSRNYWGPILWARRRDFYVSWELRSSLKWRVRGWGQMFWVVRGEKKGEFLIIEHGLVGLQGLPSRLSTLWGPQPNKKIAGSPFPLRSEIFGRLDHYICFSQALEPQSPLDVLYMFWTVCSTTRSLDILSSVWDKPIRSTGLSRERDKLGSRPIYSTT